jgi:hypothetical protein
MGDCVAFDCAGLELYGADGLRPRCRAIGTKNLGGDWSRVCPDVFCDEQHCLLHGAHCRSSKGRTERRRVSRHVAL